MQKITINGSFLTQPPTGIQRFAVEIALELQKLLPHQLEIVCPPDTKENDLFYQLKAKKIGHFSGHLWEQIDLFVYLLKRRSQLLCLDMKSPLLYTDKIITIHDLNFIVNPEWVSKSFYWLYRLMVEVGSRQSKRVLTVSHFSKNEIKRKLNVPDRKVSVIYNAISKKLNQSSQNNRLIESKYFFTVSSTDPRKNLGRLIKAYQQIKHEVEGTKLVIAGLIHPHDQNTFVDQKQNVIFLGLVNDDDLAHLYQHAEAFVYPSLYEGFGIPPLEAMSHDCPVVVSNSSSLPEVCEDAAIYIDPSNVESIAEGMKRVLQEEIRAELIQKGRKQIQQFEWGKSAELVLSNLKLSN